MRNKNSNMQMQIGIELPYENTMLVNTDRCLQVLEEAATGLLPILNTSMGRK